MALVVTNDPLTDNYATFKNDAIEDENLGECYFGAYVYNESTGKYDVPNVLGVNVQGISFDVGTLADIPAASRVNPSKVFKWIVTKIKGVLCPNCM
jgi:hypothetical protein